LTRSLEYSGDIWSTLPTIFLPTITHTLAPSAPTVVSVEATSSTSISVHWKASKKDGGSPITGYMVEYCPTSNPSFETQVVTRDGFSTTLDGLTPSTEYDVRVRGENAVGCSAPSETRRTKTDGELIEKLLPGVYVVIVEYFKLQEKFLMLMSVHFTSVKQVFLNVCDSYSEIHTE